MKPVLFVTNHVPPDRVGAFAALHEREGIELALFGGRSQHATKGVEDPGVPYRRVTEAEVATLAAKGDHRAVICGTAGRRALPAAWWGARRAKVPFLLWSALWHQPRTPAHLAAAPLMALIHRTASAVVTYGPHVSTHARQLGARRVFWAPQAVDNDFWSEPGPASDGRFTATFVGRQGREKGTQVLLEAWRASGFGDLAALVLVGVWPEPPLAGTGGAVYCHPPQPPPEVRNFYARASVVVVPSIRTRSFRQPWGLVCNEAMNQAKPIIASDETGAAAGGLVRHERNGLVVPAGDPQALAAALRRLHDDEPLRTRLGAAAKRDVQAFTYDAWAAGFGEALLACGAG